VITTFLRLLADSTKELNPGLPTMRRTL